VTYYCDTDPISWLRSRLRFELGQRTVNSQFYITTAAASSLSLLVNALDDVVRRVTGRIALSSSFFSSSYTMSPRPILKASKLDGFIPPRHYPQNVQPQHSVHFPPSPALTRTFMAHSASIYDRSPIIVSPNDCALPERGCPGRTYFEESSPNPNCRYPIYMSNSKGYHPRAFAATGLAADFDLPPLVPDLSESDESDGVAGLSPPSSVKFGPHGLPSPSIRTSSYNSERVMHSHGYALVDPDAALSFLPHSPSSFPPYPYVEDDKLLQEKFRRKREKKHDSSIDPYRISTDDVRVAQFTHAFASLSISRSPSPSRLSPSTPRKRSPRRQQASFTPTFNDDGCLGGF